MNTIFLVVVVSVNLLPYSYTKRRGLRSRDDRYEAVEAVALLASYIRLPFVMSTEQESRVKPLSM